MANRLLTFLLVFTFVLGACRAKEEAKKAETRIVEDEFWEVEIPNNPQRVAAIYLEDYLTALDIKPVVQWYHPNWGIQEHLNLDVPKFDITGSMETLLQAKPDLIIVDGIVDKAKYEEYSKIAPTYRLKEEILQDLRAITKTIADVLSIPEKANEVVQQYEECVTSFGCESYYYLPL